MKYRKFDLDAAKAGEPVMTASGDSVRLLTFDYTSPFGHPIVGIMGVQLLTWTLTGRYRNSGACEIDLVMRPLCIISDRPVYPNDILRDSDGSEFVALRIASDGFIYTYPIGSGLELIMSQISTLTWN